MANETLARRYASAIFQLATEQDAVAQVGTDLHAVVGTLAADVDVAKFFRSPVIDRNEKSAIIESAFERLHVIVLHAILLLVRKRREAIVAEIVRQYDTLVRIARGAQTLRVTSARELSQGELASIVARLTDSFKTPFDVEQNVDPALIGGVRITIGDKRIDGTIAGKLDDLARMLSTN